MATDHRGRRRLEKKEVRALFQQFQQSRGADIREELALAHESLAAYLASRYSGRGEPLEDILQVARIGLLKAIDRYDLDRGIEFTTYATPTIVGEIKRHFRDKLWAIHVPRRLRELNYTLMRAIEELSQRLGRSPTIPEISQFSGVDFEEVISALEVGRAYSLVSLDAETGEGEEEHAVSLHESMGGEDEALERLEDRATLDWALGRLPERAQQIVRMRFFDDLSQAEIARRLGISQMHVSRILREALARLRALVSDRRPAPDET
jgi:RNA polymerase sigma-B factor